MIGETAETKMTWRLRMGVRSTWLAALGLAVALGLAGTSVPAVAGGVPVGAPRPLVSTGAVARAFALYAKGDYQAAAALLTPAAVAGDARAQALLGFLYEYGRGVPQDFAMAAGWYGCSADQGDATAQYLLGLLYDKGRGVRLDVVQSQKWLILATAGASHSQRDTYMRMRDAVAGKMSRAQLALAQQQALAFLPAPPVVPATPQLPPPPPVLMLGPFFGNWAAP